MKKFVFKFSVVLDMRKTKEKEALRLLGIAQRAYQAELEKKAKLLSALQEISEKRSKNVKKMMSISEWKTEQDFIVGTKQRIIQSDQAVFRANRAVQKAFNQYAIARKESMAMETLYRHAYEDYKRKMLKQEQKELDDLLVMRSRLKEEEPI